MIGTFVDTKKTNNVISPRLNSLYLFVCLAGPIARYTHWKQSVFYLKTDLVGVEGEEIQGQISVRPNTTNPRDQDITIRYQFNGRNHPTPVDETQEFRMR